jgi:DNA-binding CsgD family transcriptional regulator
MDPVPAPERPATTGVARLVWAELGPRQRGVAEGVLAGETNAQISVRLDMSVHTVREHLKRMAGRLGARGRAGLIAGLHASRQGEAMSRSDGAGCGDAGLTDG